jgi:hypothetical protein
MPTTKNQERAPRPKSAAFLAKKAKNEAAAIERFRKLREDQALAKLQASPEYQEALRQIKEEDDRQVS